MVKSGATGRVCMLVCVLGTQPFLIINFGQVSCGLGRVWYCPQEASGGHGDVRAALSATIRITCELTRPPPLGVSPRHPISRARGLLGIEAALKLPDDFHWQPG